jgi:hypothetical protein
MEKENNKVAEQKHKYYMSTRDNRLQKQKIYNEKHIEEILRKKKDYYQKNKEQILAKRKEAYLKKKESVLV